MQENSKEQIILIGGGLSFKDKTQTLEYYKNKNIDEVWSERFWHEWLLWSLEDKYNCLKIKLPGKDNADYEIWKIVFEKYFLKLNEEDLTIVAHSLGTIFIIKYLIENGFSKKIKSLHLVSPIISNEFQPENDPENTGTFTFDFSKIQDLRKYCEEIHVWHSTDDTMCLYKNAEVLKQEIPETNLHTFSNRGHFLQSTFWELFDYLRK